jgi:hypothetical protein
MLIKYCCYLFCLNIFLFFYQIKNNSTNILQCSRSRLIWSWLMGSAKPTWPLFNSKPTKEYVWLISVFQSPKVITLSCAFLRYLEVDKKLECSYNIFFKYNSTNYQDFYKAIWSTKRFDPSPGFLTCLTSVSGSRTKMENGL